MHSGLGTSQCHFSRGFWGGEIPSFEGFCIPTKKSLWERSVEQKCDDQNLRLLSTFRWLLQEVPGRIISESTGRMVAICRIIIFKPILLCRPVIRSEFSGRVLRKTQWFTMWSYKLFWNNGWTWVKNGKNIYNTLELRLTQDSSQHLDHYIFGLGNPKLNHRLLSKYWMWNPEIVTP